MSLKHAAIKGTTSISILSYARFGLSMLTQIVLARLLTPKDFGTVTLAAAILAVLSIPGMWGLGKFIAQAKAPSPGAQDTLATTAFWLRAGYGVLFLLLAYTSVFLLRSYYSADVLEIILVLVVGQVITILGEVSSSVMLRDMMLVRLGIIEFSGTLAASLIAVWLASVGYGIWALAIYHLLRTVLPSFLSVVFSPFRPTFYFSMQHARELWHFCKHVFGTEIISLVLYRNGDDLVVGTIAGATQLGFYSISFRLSKLWHLFVLEPVMRVLIPSLAKVRRDRARLSDAYAFVGRNVTRLVIPANVLLAILAPQVIEVLFGSQWLPAVPIFRLQAVYAILSQLYQIDFNLYYALGSPKRVFRIQLASLVTFFITAIPLTFFYQAAGMAISLGLVSIVAFAFSAIWTRQMISINSVELAIRPVIGSTIAAVGATRILIYGETFSTLLQIIIVSASFGVLYLLALSVIDSRSVLQDVSLVASSLLGETRLQRP
jgi:O-antigen/teichoic acid export membrane protein